MVVECAVMHVPMVEDCLFYHRTLYFVVFVVGDSVLLLVTMCVDIGDDVCCCW